MTIKELFNEYEGKLQNERVRGIAFDTSCVKKGDIFFALEGKEHDGKAYAKAAIKNGALAVVSEKELDGVPCIKVDECRKALSVSSKKFFSCASDKLVVTAITGTNGKTTTAFMLNHILKSADKKTALTGTNGVFIGEKKFSSPLTTPDPPHLHEYCYTAVADGVTHLTMEASAHALFLDKLYGMNIEIGAFTNFTQDHLDYFGTMDEYLTAKLKLADMAKINIVNADEPAFSRITRKITYGINSSCDFRASNFTLRTVGSAFTITYKGERERVFCPLVGRYNLYNALCAVACAVSLGVSFSFACSALSSMPEVEGRINCIPLKRGSVIIDFAHTPDALKKVLTTVRELCRGSLTVVFGCGGNRDKSKRAIMGEIAAEICDRIIVTNDNPRGEEPSEIINDIVEGIKKKGFANYYIMPDRRNAINFALFLQECEDIVVIAGKGAEIYQEIKGVKYPFSDREVVLSYEEEQ